MTAIMAAADAACNPGRTVEHDPARTTLRSHPINIAPTGGTLTGDDFEQRMHAWRDAENAAVQAEGKVRQVGQAGSDPRMAQLVLEAHKLRISADTLLAALVASLKDAGAGLA